MNYLATEFMRFFVEARTSMFYVWFYAVFIAVWLVGHKTGLIAIDNGELTYLNLILSIEAGLASILVMIYAIRISERNDRKDKEEKEQIIKLMKKLDKIYKELEDE